MARFHPARKVVADGGRSFLIGPQEPALDGSSWRLAENLDPVLDNRALECRFLQLEVVGGPVSAARRGSLNPQEAPNATPDRRKNRRLV